jgi:hypothetical protein
LQGERIPHASPGRGKERETSLRSESVRQIDTPSCTIASMSPISGHSSGRSKVRANASSTVVSDPGLRRD